MRCCRSRKRGSPVAHMSVSASNRACICKMPRKHSVQYSRDPELSHTCLSFKPISSTSSISVSLGCFFNSSLSAKSLGSYAILCPFSAVYEVSGVRSWLLPAFAAGAFVHSSSASALDAAPPPPLRRVKPPCADIVQVVGAVCRRGRGVV